MTGEIILENIAFAFWYVLGEIFMVLCGLFFVYAIVLAIYTLIIKR